MNIEITLLIGIIITGLFLFIALLKKSIQMPLIAYFAIQMTAIWIFIGQNILDPIGFDFKPHAAAFLLAVLVSGYFLVKHFKTLWQYTPFRYLFMFFIISTIYAIFYKSDFRSSSYIDLWIHNNLGLQHSSIGAGHGAISRQFGGGETKFLVYLAGLAPIVAFLTGFISLQGSGADFKKKLAPFISIFSFATLIYFILLGLSLVVGDPSLIFIDGRMTIGGDFTGNDFEALWLITLVCFYLYISTNKDLPVLKFTRASIIINIAILTLLILLGIKKGTIISLFVAAHVVIYGVLAAKLIRGEKFLDLFNFNLKFNPILLFIPLLAVGFALAFNSEFCEDTYQRINQRFSSNQTLNVRQINWDLYNQHWRDNLTPLKAVFGHGIDSSREATFFLTAMHPDPSMQQPHIHNIYLEMFYNYGLMALLFFLPLLLIFFWNIKAMLTSKADALTYLSITAISFFVVFYMAESPSVPSVIIFFSLIGFIEAIRRAQGEPTKENPVLN